MAISRKMMNQSNLLNFFIGDDLIIEYNHITFMKVLELILQEKDYLITAFNSRLYWDALFPVNSLNSLLK